MELLYIRVKSFATEAGVMLLLGVISMLQSEAFADLVIEHFGEVWGGGLGLLITSGIVKHLLNIKAIKDHEKRLGTISETEPPVLI